MKTALLLAALTATIMTGCASQHKLTQPKGRWHSVNQAGFVPAGADRFYKSVIDQAQQQAAAELTAKQSAHDFVNASREFEKARIGDIEKSKNLAWKVAAGACAVACTSAVALMMLTPFKEVRPYVIRVDNNTGATDIVTMLENTTSTQSEETAKYFSAMYVQLREGYDWYTIQEQINKAMLFSDANMQNQINTKFARPDAPHKIYKDNQRVEIKITNTSIIDDKGLIQVRFTKSVVPTNGGSWDVQNQRMNPAPIVTNHMATIGYEYVNVPTLDDVRLVNPFGYTVKTYRVDDFTAAGNTEQVANSTAAVVQAPAAPVAPVQPVPTEQAVEQPAQ